jgi:hypothetical protein
MIIDSEYFKWDGKRGRSFPETRKDRRLKESFQKNLSFSYAFQPHASSGSGI